MGGLMRAYWHPVALSTQVTADGKPLLTWLLGERLVAFRDTEGRVGVLDDHCLHRGVSLSLGRNEDCGLRCIYHGWKFAVDGTLMETPNHDSAAYRERKRAKAYPVREQSGLIWTYLGPAEKEPPFRTFDFDRAPDSQRHIFRANAKANFLALWEGGVDSSHVGMLHTNDARPTWAAKRRGEEVPASAWDSLAPTYEVDDTDYGYRYVAFRAIPGRGDARHARQVPAMLPNMRIIPGHTDFAIAIIEVPMTDTETATYQVAYSHNEPITREWIRNFLGFAGNRYDEESCSVNMTWPDDLGQDREAMTTTSWSGFAAIEFEDVAMAISLNDPWDRADENLVAADIAVMQLRQMLLNAVKKHQAGETAPGSQIADMTRVVSYDRVVLDSEDWKTV
ncbi:MAG: hypothetical protein B7Z20_09930 [Sphingobium sp. 32-64-5]|nr:MAG: hypothetical protein B7Z20_09930 [Sphingobium sp. 32-64-5]